jgi:hypothetical protein
MTDEARKANWTKIIVENATLFRNVRDMGTVSDYQLGMLAGRVDMCIELGRTEGGLTYEELLPLTDSILLPEALDEKLKRLLAEEE